MRSRLPAIGLAAALAALAAPSPASARDPGAQPGASEALFTLFDLRAAQQIAKRRCVLDADGDGVGEYATLQELAGRVGVRTGKVPAADGRSAGSSFAASGNRLDPPPLAASMGTVDEDGVFVRAGYAIRILLPDSSATGLVHETAGKQGPGLAGGTGSAGADRGEREWYGWAAPLDGSVVTGSWCLLIRPDGRIYVSENEKTQRSGRAAPPDSLVALIAAAGDEVTDDLGERWQEFSRMRAPWADLIDNETAAISTLRNLASAQAQFRVSVKVDADGDGKGEFGTFLELTGSCGLRAGLRKADAAHVLGSDFSIRGLALKPAILSQRLANVDAAGVVVKSGYSFQIFLPDNAARTTLGTVHETGPASTPGLAGGSGAVGVDLAESYWCAYAQPVEFARSGHRRFFVNQAGDVLQSANVRGRDGVTPIDPLSAFRPGSKSILGTLAIGTVGCDGDIWKTTR